MKQSNTFTMTDHPFKNLFAIVTGSYFGLKAWITGTQFPLHIVDLFTMEAFFVFLIGCTKAIVIGFCSWVGASVAGWFKKKGFQFINHFKHKK